MLGPLLRKNEMMRLDLSVSALTPHADSGDSYWVGRRFRLERSLRDPRMHCLGSTCDFNNMEGEYTSFPYSDPAPFIGDYVIEAFIMQPIGEFFSSHGPECHLDLTLTVCGNVTLKTHVGSGFLTHMDLAAGPDEPDDSAVSTAAMRGRARVWSEINALLDRQLQPMLVILAHNRVPSDTDDDVESD